MLTETELLDRIDAFRKDHGDMFETEFGLLAVGDPNFVGEVRTRARSPRMKTVRKVIEFMATYTGDKNDYRH